LTEPLAPGRRPAAGVASIAPLRGADEELPDHVREILDAAVREVLQPAREPSSEGARGGTMSVEEHRPPRLLSPPASVSADDSTGAGAGEAASEAQDELPVQTAQLLMEARSYLKLTASKPGYLSATALPIYLDAPETRRIDLQLARGSEVEGRVVDAAGEGIARAEVWLAAASFAEADGEIQESAVADDEGYFRFEHAPRGDLTLRASVRGGGFRATDVLVREGERPLIKLGRGCELEFAVSDRLQAPQPSARIALAQQGLIVYEQQTGEDGSARLLGIDDGEYELRVYYPEKDLVAHREKIALTAEESATRAFELPETGTIRGRVRVAGDVENLGTWLNVILVSSCSDLGGGTFQYHSAGCTIEKSEFEFADLPPGEYRLYVTNYVKSEEEGVVAECAALVPADGGAVSAELFVENVARARLIVEVRDAAGTVIEAAARAHREPFGQHIDHGRAAADAPLVLEGYLGEWKLFVEAPGFRRRIVRVAPLAAGEERALAVTLESLGPPGLAARDLFPTGAQLYINSRLSLEALIHHLAAVRGAPMRLHAELQSSAIARRQWDPISFGDTDPAALFETLLNEFELRWRLDGNAIVLEQAR
ncbi:MAG: carboxypeptidase-like regulatory domain-containing protein, partial [Planctomycetes bacterium]|nr:carboxypeptidase-like regulatory domain-containing protein [Planctomycetota bacterium]